MKKIKVGVFGAGRGMDIAAYFMMQGCELVALCERDKERSDKVLSKLPETAVVYDNFDEFIKHDMDAVILGNNFHEHAPYAIKCFEHGIHVFSECLSNSTMAEGVELIRAFEKSKSIYMIAENYPQMRFTREMKRLCDAGALGKILYAEGEYNHPGNPLNTTNRKRLNYYPKHWRNYLPRTYYITHSIGPIMWATGATPKKVTAFASFAPGDKSLPRGSHNGDRVAIVTTLNDDGSIFRVTGNATFGGIHNSYRVCGTNGQIENVRGMGEKVMLRYNEWSKPEGVENAEQLYTPDWNDKDEELIKKSGHGGGDYLTPRMFIECIKEGKQPEHPFDIYSAVNMASVGILAHRSVLNGGAPYDIPDFRLEEERVKYENDDATPFYYTDGRTPTIPCCSHPDYAPTDEQVEKYFECLKK